jgi:5-methylcytosine-specific restriction enzyme B
MDELAMHPTVKPVSMVADAIAALRSGDGKNFIIFRGVSGTGKSRMVAALAKVIFGSQTVDPPHLTVIEVRPDWTDGSPVLGHYDPVAGKYNRQPFLDALIAANTSASPVFVCLDEMNLARVEYYLAECLSAMESGNEITLDTRGDKHVPARVAWPKTLYLFGTINVDESTLSISDKVLDRAQVIDTSQIDLLPVLKSWIDATADLDENEKKKIGDTVGGVWTALRSIDAHFGFRAARAVFRFIVEAKASSGGTISVDAALDAQLCQKILVKLRGEGDKWTKPLDEIEKLSAELGAHQSARRIVSRMRRGDEIWSA